MHLSRQIPGLVAILGLGTLISSILPSVNAQCGQMHVRKEVREMSPSEFRNFIDAIQELKSGTSPTRYDRYAQLHLRYQRDIHGNPHFFPWHRQFTLDLERDLQRINPSVTVPYWDWSLDAANPADSPVLQEDMMGGNSFGQCLESGPFAGWQRPYPSTGCLRRRYSQGSRIGAFANPSIINVMTVRSTEYDEFRRSIEIGPHAGPHNGIGADMAGMQSPADPLFFLHHSFIDKIWHDWQRTRPQNMYKFDGTYQGRQVSADDDIVFYPGRRVRDVMDISQLCYQYSGSATGAPSAAQTDEQEDADLVRRALLRRAEKPEGSKSGILLKLGAVTSEISKRLTKVMDLTQDEVKSLAQDLSHEMVNPAPIPEAYCRMNNYDISEVRAQEAAVGQVIDSVNEVFRNLSPKSHSAY